MAFQEENKKKRIRRKLKLSMGQRKKQKQFIHNRSCLQKGDKYCKRKNPNLDGEDCIPQKVQILDIENVNEQVITEICSKEGNVDKDICENIENNVTCKDKDNIAETTYSFYIHKKPSEEKKCLSGENNSSESTTDNEVEDENVNDVCEQYYRRICNRSLLIPLIEKLDKCDLLKDFTNLIEVLSNGTLEVENIPLLLCLERTKLCKCATTTLMRSHPKSKAFWRVAY